MATDGTPPGSGQNQAPSEQPADPPLTESNSTSANSTPAPPTTVSTVTPKPKLQTPSPPRHNAHPLQVHVPHHLAAGGGYPRHMLPGGLMQPMGAQPLPAAQAGLIPFPYGQPQILAAAAPRGLPNQLVNLAALQAQQPMMVGGGGIMRPQRRTFPVAHPYQRVVPHHQAAAAAQLPGAAATAQILPVMPAARAAALQQLPPTAAANPYGQMLIPVSSAGLPYRVPYMQPQPVQMDPTTALLYSQYAQAYQPYLQQVQQVPHSAATTQMASANGQLQYDPQKLLANAHYTQMLVPDQNSTSPGAYNNLNGSASAQVVDGKDQS